MTTICPKCRTVRPADAQVPDWQCPACGVAYAKAGGSSAAFNAPRPQRAVASPGGGGLPWGKLFGVLVLALALGGGYKVYNKLGGAQALASIAAKLTVSAPQADLVKLAASTRPGDIVIYSAAWCGNCTQAKAWMHENGFAYTECDVEKSHACASEFARTGSQGIPYLIVRGQHLNVGFDADELVQALSKTQG